MDGVYYGVFLLGIHILEKSLQRNAAISRACLLRRCCSKHSKIVSYAGSIALFSLKQTDWLVNESYRAF